MCMCITCINRVPIHYEHANIYLNKFKTHVETVHLLIEKLLANLVASIEDQYPSQKQQSDRHFNRVKCKLLFNTVFVYEVNKNPGNLFSG